MTDDLFIDSQRFSRGNRLLQAEAYDEVFKRAQRSSDQYFTVLYCRNGLGYPRLGLAIAKKRVRRAVGRNRLKRVVRESFRRAKKQLLGTDIVIMARDRAAVAANPDLFASLDRHWQAIAKKSRGHDSGQ